MGCAVGPLSVETLRIKYTLDIALNALAANREAEARNAVLSIAALCARCIDQHKGSNRWGIVHVSVVKTHDAAKFPYDCRLHLTDRRVIRAPFTSTSDILAAYKLLGPQVFGDSRDLSFAVVNGLCDLGVVEALLDNALRAAATS